MRYSPNMVPTRSSRTGRVGSSFIADQHAVQEYPRLLNNAVEVLFAVEAFGVELANILRPGWARGEPAAPSHDLHTAERRAGRRGSEHVFDRLVSQVRRCHVLG